MFENDYGNKVFLGAFVDFHTLCIVCRDDDATCYAMCMYMNCMKLSKFPVHSIYLCYSVIVMGLVSTFRFSLVAPLGRVKLTPIFFFMFK